MRLQCHDRAGLNVFRKLTSMASMPLRVLYPTRLPFTPDTFETMVLPKVFLTRVTARAGIIQPTHHEDQPDNRYHGWECERDEAKEPDMHHGLFPNHEGVVSITNTVSRQLNLALSKVL